MTYKIKGSGDARTVVAGARVVGQLRRHEKPVIATTYRPNSISFRKTVEVWWRAYTADGQRLGRGSPWRGASRQTLKAWTDPARWEGLTTQPAPAPEGTP